MTGYEKGKLPVEAGRPNTILAPYKNSVICTEFIYSRNSEISQLWALHGVTYVNIDKISISFKV